MSRAVPGHWILATGVHTGWRKCLAGDLRHGEAVAIGVAMDSVYSYLKSMISRDSVVRIRETLEGVGLKLWHPALASLDIYRALEDFREHLGGQLCITLLTGEGSAIEVHDIDVELMEISSPRKYWKGNRAQLTYCTSIHSGEGWEDVMRNLQQSCA
ncbi:MAG: hypothetical protein ACFHHU_03355 [Porticoccaceae bacterium]